MVREVAVTALCCCAISL